MIAIDTETILMEFLTDCARRGLLLRDNEGAMQDEQELIRSFIERLLIDERSELQ